MINQRSFIALPSPSAGPSAPWGLNGPPERLLQAPALFSHLAAQKNTSRPCNASQPRSTDGQLAMIMCDHRTPIGHTGTPRSIGYEGVPIAGALHRGSPKRPKGPKGLVVQPANSEPDRPGVRHVADAGGPSE
jgi:hypothetical protein